MSEELPPASDSEIEQLVEVVDGWLLGELGENPAVIAVDRDPDRDQVRWLVRMQGEEKSKFSIWFHLQQRTLQLESYVCPAPLENQGAFFEYFLRQNLRLNGVAFCIGAEDGIYLRSHLPVPWISPPEMDRLFGTIYAATEMCFVPAMRIGYGDKFTG